MSDLGFPTILETHKLERCCNCFVIYILMVGIFVCGMLAGSTQQKRLDKPIIIEQGK